MSDSITKLYYGKNIDVTFDPKRCIHAAECVNNLPEVFDTSRRPWILTDNADADEVARVVKLCPTGALHFMRKDGGKAEEPAPKSRVFVVADGPLYVRGPVTVMSANGKVLLDDTRVALCRCGASLNKPFCDNSHLAIAFEDACQFANTVVPGAAAQAATEPGCLKIVFKETGSYRLEGQFEIIGANGDRLFQGTQAFLCRCGGSLNKPFCDGTHRKLIPVK
jgi:CDGSH-type Zn-finger protein/uncharacterized Fe-S cluster protein YjdI